MKRTLQSALGAWIFSLILVSAMLCSPQEHRRQRTRTTDPHYKLDCQRNLTKIYDALRQYSEKHGSIPNWLSDLIPEFLSDPEVLRCPYVVRTGDLSTWRSHLLREPGNDPLTYYHY